MRTLLIFLITLVLTPSGAYAREDAVTFGFYNLENLFDTINEPGRYDDDFTPRGRNKWDTPKYYDKLSALSRAINLFAPDILGVCEAENRAVLEDLARQPALERLGYDVIHYDSPDPRGSDVALIYRRDRITVLSSEPVTAPGGRATRDILRVEASSGELTFSIYIVHLPSRRGNDPAATRQRWQIVEALDRFCEAELSADPARCVIVAGDFNDNPDSKMLRGIFGSMYNATAKPFAQGKGSYAWRDVWQMYDQILVSDNMKSVGKWRLEGDATVINRPELLQNSGRFASYPAKWKVSDHLPVMVKFEKK